MGAAGQSVCLNMIVKNEAPVIRRCLDSVRPYIDYWVIVDTGSTDGTQEIIREHLRDVPGRLYQRPWRDFAHNRSEALALARGRADYTLIIDADDALEGEPGAALPPLTADSYTVKIRDAGHLYQRTQLVKNALPWRYEGVLHEYLTCDGAGSDGHLAEVWIRRNHDGARRRDPQTYRRDAAMLAAALETETDPFLRSRYRFYLAQSYRDCGDWGAALDNYLQRAELGFWQEEVFVSLYQAARMMEQLGRADDEVIAAYERAAAFLPTRAEALHGAARFCRLRDRFEQGYGFARRGLAIDPPTDGLFLESWIHVYGLLDELAVNAYWTGRYQEALDACERLLAEGRAPADMVERVRKNAEFSRGKLTAKPAPAAATGWTPPGPLGGTELMVRRLSARLGGALDRVNLLVNLPAADPADTRPKVAWMHHDADQAAVQWCADRALTDPVRRFVFVSYWQRQRYLAAFGLRPERCVVIKHALDQDAEPRRWEAAPTWRCAYASTPFRGLSVLLDAWERLSPAGAELHIWSSMKLYAQDDGPYEHLYARARSMPGVIYQGLAPNEELRAAMRTMHFMTYPSTFAETACLTAIEAMSAGCRLIVPSLGALPETTGGFARVYPSNPDPQDHAAVFAEVLAAEMAAPWGGDPAMAGLQQAYCAAVYDWPGRLAEWLRLIEAACG